MTIRDLCEMFPEEQHIKIYDLEDNANVIFDGSSEDVPLEMDIIEIDTIDNLDGTAVLGINVSL